MWENLSLGFPTKSVSKPCCSAMKTSLNSRILYESSLDIILCSEQVFSHRDPNIFVYQSPLILTALLHIDLINVAHLMACAFIRSSWFCTFWMTTSMTLNWHKLDNDVIIASLKSESTCKLINRIPGSWLLISSLPASASRTHVKSLGKPPDVNKRSRSLTW